MSAERAEQLDRGPAGDGAPHLRARAARQRRRARAGAVEEGAVHGRQGRRRVRGLHHRRDRLRPVHRARRALRRGHGPRLDDGGRLLPFRRARAHPARREHRPHVPSRRPGQRAGDQGGHGAAADRPGPDRHPRARARLGAESRPAPQQGGAEGGAAPEGARQSKRASRASRASRARAGRSAPREGNDQVCGHRHRRSYRSREELARPGADRHRSGSAEGREGPRHHHRPRDSRTRRLATSISRSSTCRDTSVSSRTCWPGSAASTPCCWSSPPTSR